MANNYSKVAEEAILNVGGKENITKATHCVSRLRFHVKDESKVKVDAIKAMDGAIGYQKSGNEHQIIVGATVSHVFEEVEKMLGEKADHELVKDEPKKLTVSGLLSNVTSNLTACIYPALCLFVVAGLAVAIPSILGPSMLNVLPAESGISVFCNAVYNAMFYFMPIFLGYSAAKHFGMSPFSGMALGAILIAPQFVALVSGGGSLSIFGIPVMMNDYSMSVLPIIIIVWIGSYLEKTLKKYVPASLELLVIPFVTVMVMGIVGLCLLAPIGYIAGKYLSNLLYWMHSSLGPVGTGVMAAVYLLLIMTGMHHTINMVALTAFLTVGYDDFLFCSFGCAWAASVAVALAFALKTKDTKLKTNTFTSVFFQVVVGLGEPIIYGVLLPYKENLLAHMIGAFAGGLYLGIMNVKIYAFLGSNFLCILHYSGASLANMINGIVGMLIAAIISFVLVWLFGNKKEAK